MHTKGIPLMDEYESLTQTERVRKYQVVFVPKCRRRTRVGNHDRLTQWHRGREATPLAALSGSQCKAPSSAGGYLLADRAALYQSSQQLTHGCPFALSNGHDLPGLIDQGIPGIAAVVDDIVEGFEDAV
jgi:hypothetical protein